jgi:hypothetical protein
MLNNVEQFMTGKRKPPIGFRLYDDEEERLNTLLAEVKQRNRSMDRSKLLREAIGFDPRSNLTDADLAYLQTGRRSNAQPNNVVLIKSPYNYGIIADTTGIADHIVIKVLAGDTEGIDPQVVERIRIEAQKQLGKITDIGDKLANGRQ